MRSILPFIFLVVLACEKQGFRPNGLNNIAGQFSENQAPEPTNEPKESYPPTTESPVVSVDINVEEENFEEDDSDDRNQEDDKDIDTGLADKFMCSNDFDGKQAVKITGNQTEQNLTPDDYLKAKVAGNKSVINITISGEDEATMSGLCLFLTGNEATANIYAKTNVGVIEIHTAGNKAKVNLQIEDDYELKLLKLDQRGNSIDVTTEGNILNQI